MSNKYIKKPIIIDAFQYGVDEKPGWFLEKVKTNDIKTITDNTTTELDYCEIKTLEGVIRGNCFDYIIKGVKGEIYPCKPDIFNMTYSIYTTGNL